MNNNATLVAHCGTRKVTREELKQFPVPEATRTHQPLSHFEIVEVLEEALSFRYLKVTRDEYAVSPDGMRMFGVMELNQDYSGCRFSIGLRNSNDKSMRLALTVGFRVFVCDNLAFSGDFYPLSHKHTRNLELSDAISIAVDRIQRGFEPMKEQIRAMKERVLTEEAVKLIIYQAFLDKGIKGIPRHLMPVIHEYYFHPRHEAFTPRNLWSLSNAFTSALKKLAPVKQFEVTARLGDYIGKVQEELKEKQELEFELQRDGKLIPISQGAAEPGDSGEEDFDLDDAAEDLEFEEAFDEYFDREEESEAIDQAEDDEMTQEFKRRIAA